MEALKDFITQNFILLCAALMMVFIAIQRFRQHKKLSIYSIVIIVCAFCLAVFQALEDYSKATGKLTETLVFSIIGYLLRPLCAYVFILLNKEAKKASFVWVTALPLIINTIVFSLTFIPNIGENVVSFYIGSDGTVCFGGGILRYSSHIVSAVYLSLLIYLAIKSLRSKHFVHGIIVICCATFAILSVIIETFFNSNGDIHLLNTVIALDTLFYYLFIFAERTQKDDLTGFYNRMTFNNDSIKMNKTITCVIQLNMNGLKEVNESKGHAEGNKALISIAKAIQDNITRKMYAYRMSGDEFVILVNSTEELDVFRQIQKIRQGIDKTGYSCSVGYCMRRTDETVEDLLKTADKAMYLDKTEYYQTTEHERCHVGQKR